jgi:hypothetical protein
MNSDELPPKYQLRTRSTHSASSPSGPREQVTQPQAQPHAHNTPPIHAHTHTEHCLTGQAHPRSTAQSCSTHRAVDANAQPPTRVCANVRTYLENASRGATPFTNSCWSWVSRRSCTMHATTYAPRCGSGVSSAAKAVVKVGPQTTIARWAQREEWRTDSVCAGACVRRSGVGARVGEGVGEVGGGWRCKGKQGGGRGEKPGEEGQTHSCRRGRHPPWHWKVPCTHLLSLGAVAG